MKHIYTLIALIYLISVSKLNAQISGPVSRVYANSQTNSSWGLGAGGISSADNAIDNSSSTASSLTIGLALVAGGYQQILTFASAVPANTAIHVKVGTVASGVNVGGYTIVAALDDNGTQISSTGNVSVIGLLGGENTNEYVITNTVAVKSIRVRLGSTVGLGITANVYGAYYEISSTGSLPTTPFDVLAGTETTSLLNVGSALSSVLNPYNCIDGDTATTATLFAAANIAAQQQVTGLFAGLYPSGSYAHVLIGDPGTLLSLSLINGPITVQLLNNGVVVQSTESTGWNLIDLELLGSNTSKGWLNIPATASFNQVKVISNSSVVGLLQSFNVYEITRDYNTSVLPVNYSKELNAVYSDNKVNLSWTTGIEINNSYFSVMRSLNATDWSQIGRVDSHFSNGSGNGSSYNFVDNTPNSGVNYYRLIQYDLDGKSALSKIISINIQSILQPAIKIYPNPTTDRVNIDNVPSGSLYKVIDLSGKIILTGTLNTSPGYISLSNVKSGIVIIELFSPKGIKIGSYKIIKN
ncbi:T9SS type A sorting domain-containing protein [Rhizosphaericola mali]|uniref:T9SS type A sorting domain-containing protein n=1 Tax=Rhizosphaericola mali TaxID=2545455 RepID=A0A5P2G490_9BACT|nr:T9SS type A sorting domain-containing protein [Rhizosphaericola mali]QES90325.1 T9SS type A sorting domain-containing protein [Rhizosphaericola mali]